MDNHDHLLMETPEPNLVPPLRPGAEEVLAAVWHAFGEAPLRILDCSHQPAYQPAVYLLRLVGNLSLGEVAERFRVSPGRISQIQAQIEQGRVKGKLASLLQNYKLKP
jgi:hypothetical protein